MKKFTFITLFCFVLISCSNKKNETIENDVYYENGILNFKFVKLDNSNLTKVFEYDSNGQIKAIGYINKNQKRDSIISYYVNNKLIQTLTVKNGVTTGPAIWYYPDGKIKEQVCLKNNMRVGVHKYFRKDGYLKQENFYKIINNQSVLNGIIRYDNNEKIIKDSSEYVDLILNKDTINLNEELKYELFVLFKKKNGILSRVILGDFDIDYNLKDSSSLEYFSIYKKNIKTTHEEGENYLRLIVEFKDTINFSESNKILKWIFFVEKKYYVTPARRNL
ncbi:MAG: hypothetical protein KAT68_05555 [Bacteroidales bacterium]|nr:hypothetical protein [Bacteroidales bacterium]